MTQFHVDPGKIPDHAHYLVIRTRMARCSPSSADQDFPDVHPSRKVTWVRCTCFHPMLWAQNSIGSMCPFFQPLEALCSLLNISPSAFLFREELGDLHVISVPSRNLTWHNTWNTKVGEICSFMDYIKITQFQDPAKKNAPVSWKSMTKHGTNIVRLVAIAHGITRNGSCAWEHCSCCLKVAALARPAARNIASEFQQEGVERIYTVYI